MGFEPTRFSTHDSESCLSAITIVTIAIGIVIVINIRAGALKNYALRENKKSGAVLRLLDVRVVYFTAGASAMAGSFGFK